MLCASKQSNNIADKKMGASGNKQTFRIGQTMKWELYDAQTNQQTD